MVLWQQNWPVVTVRVDRWLWNICGQINGSEKPNRLEITLPQCHFFHHKSRSVPAAKAASRRMLCLPLPPSPTIMMWPLCIRSTRCTLVRCSRTSSNSTRLSLLCCLLCSSRIWAKTEFTSITRLNTAWNRMQNMGIFVRVTQVYFFVRNSHSIPINYEIYSLEAYLVANILPFYIWSVIQWFVLMWFRLWPSISDLKYMKTKHFIVLYVSTFLKCFTLPDDVFYTSRNMFQYNIQ